MVVDDLAGGGLEQGDLALGGLEMSDLARGGPVLAAFFCLVLEERI